MSSSQLHSNTHLILAFLTSSLNNPVQKPVGRTQQGRCLQGREGWGWWYIAGKPEQGVGSVEPRGGYLPRESRDKGKGGGLSWGIRAQAGRGGGGVYVLQGEQAWILWCQTEIGHNNENSWFSVYVNRCRNTSRCKCACVIYLYKYTYIHTHVYMYIHSYIP